MPSDSALALVSAYGENGASTRVRLYDWQSHLNLTAQRHEYLGGSDNGARTLAKSVHSVAHAELELRRLKSRLRGRTIVLSRQASPLSAGIIEESLLRNAEHGVYDFDDAIWSDNSGLAKKFWSRSALWERSVLAADVVIAGSDNLAEAAAARSRHVVMIPSCVEPSRYSRKASFEMNASPRAVWIGSGATEHFLKPLFAPLIDLNRRFGLRLTIVGARSSNLGELDSLVDRVPWSAESFGDELSRADFGVMPLPDTDYTRGKCSYKLLQYGAAGIPVIGSPVGANVSVLQKMGGLAPTRPIEWHDAMESILAASTEERASMGRKAHETVSRDFSFERWRPDWTAAVGPASASPEIGHF